MTLEEEIEYRYNLLINSGKKILNSKDDSISFYLKLIQEIGIYDDGRKVYYDDNKFINKYSGLWQNPFQFASLLSFLSCQNLSSYCEIGTFQCWTTFFISIVLSKKNKLKTTGIDIKFPITNYVFDALKFFDVEYQHIIGNSNNIKNNKYDLVFIDADHSYDAIEIDWNNVGKFSKICIFHDIDDLNIKNAIRENDAPKKFFDKVYKNRIAILSDNPIMGLGIVINELTNNLEPDMIYFAARCESERLNKLK